MNTIQAQEGMWLFNGESFAKKVSGFGNLSKWEEVTEEFKVQWEEEHKVEDGLTSELLCDLTTTEYAISAEWTQGDNGQVFDDYKEIYIKMLLQPTENSVDGFRINISKDDISAWGGKYGMKNAATGLSYPSASKNDKTILCFVRLWKTLDGIEQRIRSSFNAGSVSCAMTTVNDAITMNSRFKNTELNPPEVLEDVSFIQHFECIKIGSYVANMPPNCRFMIYGIK